MPKARQVRGKLVKLGWEQIHQKGSHHKMRRDGETRIFSYHDSVELGATQLRKVAKAFGVSEDELR